MLYDTKPGLMKVWVPLVWFTVAVLVVLMEVGIAYGFSKSVSEDPDRWWDSSFDPDAAPATGVPDRVPQIDRS